MITPSFSLTATERVLPRMALDFTTASLDSRVTFTRAGNTATVVDSSGFVVPINANLPRFDFNPTTLVCRGLLIEEARTNLLTYSSDFDNAAWVKVQGTVTKDAVMSPDGTVNAEKFTENTANSTHYPVQTPTVSATTSYVMSCFLKSAGRTKVTYVFENSAKFAGVDFNLSNGTAGTPFGTLASTTAGVDDYGNGWYRCWMKVVTESGTTTQVQYRLNNGTTDSYTGDGTSGVYMWGAQLEAGAFATSYIPTVASTVTRTADVATMTGANFSSWFNASEGAFLVVADRIYSGNFVSFIYPFTANDNTQANEIAVLSSNGTTQMQIGMNVGGVSQLDFAFGLFNVDPSKMIATYKQNNTQFGMNGLSKTTDTSCNIPTVTQLAIGRRTTGGYWAGHIQKLSYYPQRLISAELAAFSK